MRITHRVLMSALLVVGGPSVAALAQEGVDNSEIHALFNDVTPGVTSIDPVGYASDEVDFVSDEVEGVEDENVDLVGYHSGSGSKGGYLSGVGKKKKSRVSSGGQLRLRYHSEGSQGFSADGVVGPGPGVGFQGTDEDFLLTRLRLWTDVQLTKNVRFYVEGIFAENGPASDTFQPRIIDRNYGDFYNLFFDTKLTDNLTVRVGRFDHLYGAQRLLSPLDWANTRQRFEGVKFLYQKDDWTIDAWWSVFVPVDPNDLDEGDYNEKLYGFYATYTGAETANYDFYYIGSDNSNPPSSTAVAAFGADPVNGQSLHTIGSRLWGGQGPWLYEAEGGYQFGNQDVGIDHRASFFTVGLGKKLKIAESWKPTLWFYYDYASGDDEDDVTFNRFDQLFPLAHKFLGFADFAQRANISSPNIQLTFAPSKKWSFLFWYYYIAAADQSDIVPGVATSTTPLQNDTSTDFIHTLDITAKYTISAKSNILFGLSTVWAGDKLEGGVADVLDPDANFFYTQWTLNF